MSSFDLPSRLKSEQHADFPSHTLGDLYGPLEHGKDIRLLVVEPGDFNAPIVCSLGIVLLDAHTGQAYETISYAWGDETRRASLQVNGCYVDVPESSASAIRRVRLLDRPRTIWIDSICINQANIEEKSSQVSKMASIYRQSSGNLVHLGEGPEQTAHNVTAVLRSVESRIDQEVQSLSESAQILWRQGFIPETFHNNDFASNEEFECLKLLVDLPWFSRLWPLQEVALSQKNTCFWADTVFELDHALMTLDVARQSRHASTLVGQAKEGLSAAVLDAVALRSLLRQIKLGLSLNWDILLIVTERRLTKDPRDHIFSLTGLVQVQNGFEKLLPLLYTDYRKTTTEVFRDATRAALQGEDDSILVAISHSSVENLCSNEAPSWMVDFKTKPRTGGEDVPVRLATFGAEAGRDPAYSQMVQNLQIASSHPDLLVVKGFLLPPISWTLPSATTNDIRYDRLALQALIGELLIILGQRSTPGEENYDVAANLLSAGSWDKGWDGFSSLQEAGAALKCLHNLSTWPPSSQSPEARIWNRTRSKRRVFALETELFGNGPLLTCSGDRLFIMQGGHHPCVVRPVGDQYLLVGVAHVPGLMRGEVLKLGVVPEWITIK